MSQLEAIKVEIMVMQDYYEKAIKLLHERIDKLCVELDEVIRANRS